MTGTNTGMTSELRESPEVLRFQPGLVNDPIKSVVRQLAQHPPTVVVTCARGSSAHAATFGKHVIERHIAIPCAAFAPNIASVYRQRLQLKDQLFLAISQSGSSDDLVESTEMAAAAGAMTVAIVNDVDSALAKASHVILPIGAGREQSVAATKTFVATLGVILRLVAAWGQVPALSQALDRLPDRLAHATELDWSAAVEAFASAHSLLTIGRGPTLAIAREAALKFKEICAIHAEAFSGAELMHGPISLISSRYPVLMFMPSDLAAAGLEELAKDLRHKGASLYKSSFGKAEAGCLPALPPDQSDADAVCLIQSFYSFAILLARKRGIDANQPRHLRKVTRTR